MQTTSPRCFSLHSAVFTIGLDFPMESAICVGVNDALASPKITRIAALVDDGRD
jgi:hypothetical protein